MFNRMPWNAAIRRCVGNFHFRDSLLLFCQMRRVGSSHVDYLSLAAAIKSSAMILDVGLGESIHGFVTRSGYCFVVAVQKALIDMYARLNMLDKSVHMFKEMVWKDCVTWNILMSGYTRLGYYRDAMDLFHSMHVGDGVMPNAVSIAVILPACIKVKASGAARSIHGLATKTGMLSETLIGNSLVSLYAKCGSSMDHARRVFDFIGTKDVVSWNSIIAAYAENGSVEEALSLFSQMVSMGFRPNGSTVANVLPLLSLNYRVCHWGKAIHCLILRSHFEVDAYVCNALMVYYARVGDMKCVRIVFDNMHEKDVISWNTIIAGCSLNGFYPTALALFHEMIAAGMTPDSITIVNILPVCAHLHDVFSGKMIHAYVSKDLLLSKETNVSNALINFYSKCKDMENALQTFVTILQKDLVSWNTMLSSLADNEKWDDLIRFLKHMLKHHVRLDHVSILTVLRACARLTLRMLREVHGYAIRAGFIGVLTIGNSLIGAYAKSGSIDYAFRIFDHLPEYNIITYNTMISAFMGHGLLTEAEALFNQMEERDIGTFNVMVQLYAHNHCFDEAMQVFVGLQRQKLKPDSVSIMSILPLSAYSASDYIVKQCHGYALRNYFDDLHLHAAFLDAYSKSGSVFNACKLFQSKRQSDVVTFTAMIGGFARGGMAKEALRLYYRMLELNIKPDHVIMISLLFACSHAGLLDEGWKLFKTMEINLTIEHYSCIIDLFARNGRFKEAYTLLASMPHEINANMWGALLGACKIHGEVEIAQLAAKQLFKIEWENIGNYVVLSNVYALDGRWDDVENVRELMKARDLRKPAGCSWIEVEKTRHIFIVDDLVHPERKFIYFMLNNLNKEIKESLH